MWTLFYDIEGVWAKRLSGLKQRPVQAECRLLQCFVLLSEGTHISFIAALLSFLPRLYYLVPTPPWNKLFHPETVRFACVFVGAIPAKGSSELALTWLPQSIPQSHPGPLNWTILWPTSPGLPASLNTDSLPVLVITSPFLSHCQNLHPSYRYLSAQKDLFSFATAKCRLQSISTVCIYSRYLQSISSACIYSLYLQDPSEPAPRSWPSPGWVWK